MNHRQEHVSPYPPFQPVPMPRNAAEGRTLLVIVIVVWMLGFGLMLWIGRRRR